MKSDEMCHECYRLLREHTIRERRVCLGLPQLVAPPEPVPVPAGLTISDVRRIVAEMLPDEHPDSDVMRAGILLLSAFQVGPSNKPLREFTGLPWIVIDNGGFYARRAGIWGRNRIVCEWEEPGRTGAIAFIADCLVVAGRIFRETTFDADGAPRVVYRERMLGDYGLVMVDGMDEVPWADVARPELRERRRLERAARQDDVAV